MKKLTTVACMCLASLACVGGTVMKADAPLGGSVLNRLVSKAQTPFTASPAARHDYNVSKLRERMAVSGRDTSGVRAGVRLLAQEELRTMAENAKKERLDSVVCTQNSTGEKVSLQTFTYDEVGRPELRVNSLLDSNGEWMPVEYYGYTWDEDDYCLSQWGKSDFYNSGQRIDYTYNDRKLGDTQTIYNYVDGQWQPSEKGEYWYDERGNLNEEKTYFYVDGQLWPSSWTQVTFDEAGRQTSYYSRVWNGSEWVSNGDKVEYAYDKDGHQTLWSFSSWQEDTKTWLNWYRIEQDFNDKGLITRQESLYWNKSSQSWDGCEDYGYGLCYNLKTVFEYDAQGRETREDAYTAYTPGKYTIGGSNVYTWTELEDGGTQLYRVSMLYDGDGENPWEEGRVTETYNKNGKLVSKVEVKNQLGKWLYQYAEEYTYTAAGDMETSCTYAYENGDPDKRRADVREQLVYDGNHNIIDSYYSQGQGTSDDDWMNVSRFTYAYEQDTVRVEKMSYAWNGSEYTPNWGEGVSFDYSVPVDELMQWIGASLYHKTTETRSYTGQGSEWGWQAFKYYYTDLTGGTGIHNAVSSTGDIRLKSAFVTDRVELVSDNEVGSVRIYNTQGILVLKAAGSSISVASLPKGMYIVNADGFKARFLKK